jgi:glycosyltransferase involved in cell wall biosynthesis
LEEQTRRLSLENHVHFLGWRSNASSAMAAFDVYLAPSVWEGMSNALLEAMNQELPIVGSNIPSFCEIIEEGKTGYLTPVTDAQSLVAPLVTLLSDRALSRQMGSAGRKRLEAHFSLEQAAAKMLALYQDTLET